MRYFFPLVFFVLLAGAASAASIRGVVKDAQTGEELVGAMVVLKEEPTAGAVSGLNGSFAISASRSDGVLRCSYLGYKAMEVPFGSAGAKPEVLTIRLEPAQLEVGEVVVYGSAAGDTEAAARSAERISPSVVSVVSAKAIELSPDVTVANVVQRVSGVTVERTSSGDGQYAILRGMDKRYSYTLVNGVKIPSPDSKNRFVPLDIFPSELLDRLEVTKSLTADMEGDAVGGAVNLAMKDAPARRTAQVSLSTGYSALFLSRSFYSFDAGAAAKSSPYELYGESYPAKPRDFSSGLMRLRSGGAPPDLLGGFSFGDRLLGGRLGLMLAGSCRRSYRGSNSAYYGAATATSDASNLPVLTDKNDRTYSEQHTRYGLHAKLDYRFGPRHRLMWYNAYMDFGEVQVRDNRKTDLIIGYNPAQGDYNLAFDTRFRLNRQRIASSTLRGDHRPGSGALRVGWAAAYSGAFNETPDNTSIHTQATVKSGAETLTSVVTLGGADRRWERNADEDWAGYLNLAYTLAAGERGVAAELAAGALYRDKRRSSFFNQYDFRPYDAGKPDGARSNLIRGVDWSDYSEISFMVFTPHGAVGNPLSYDASERIAAAYGQAKLALGALHLTAGLRMEHTRQGYDLRYAIAGVPNAGNQRYADLLPSLHLKYSPAGGSSSLRAAYYKSISRPGFFEIVPYRILNEDFTEAGNPDLKHTVAHSAELRYEYFPRPSEQLMAGVFYKRLANPIEYGMVVQGQGTFYMPGNFGSATCYGLELDATKYFYAFGLKGSYTLTHSQITTTKLLSYDNPAAAAAERILVKNVAQTRPLSGQSRHAANLTLLYRGARSGWDAQLAVAYTGEHLYAVSRYANSDVWQGGYLQLDAAAEKRLKVGLTLFAKAANLLNTPLLRYIKQQNAANEGVEGYESRSGATTVRRDYYGQAVQVGARYRF
ncbi:MAG: outer membrane beta-barrel protein [Prevotellaceae bacterium]|jgi:TonB-dependent receptor|nr:outer membrane beta-barrel protein [Prevotellaceae bacterium]